MNMHELTTSRPPAAFRFIRAATFLLLSLEGAFFAALYLVGLGYGLVTGNELLVQLWRQNPLVLLALGALLIASLVATVRQVSQRAWTRIPALLLAWISIGGGLLFYQTFLAFPPTLIPPCRLLMALAALALALSFAVFLREQRERSTIAGSSDPGDATAGHRNFSSAGSSQVCGRCGKPNPRHLVSLQDGSQPTHLCDGCYQVVIRPKTAFQEQRRLY
jgi:hypothetical protein